MRSMQGPSPSSTVGGPSFHELVGSSIKVDTLKQLVAKDREDGVEGNEGALNKLIALEQVTLRGEDLTSELTKKKIPRYYSFVSFEVKHVATLLYCAL